MNLFNRNRIHLLFILHLAFLLRLLLFMVGSTEPHRYLDADSPDYDTIAVNLLESGSYSTDHTPPRTPNFKRTPGYPTFLSGVYVLFGPRNYQAAIFFQIFLGTITVWLTYLIACQFFDRRTGLLAALMFALDPVSIIYANTLLTETIFTLFAVAGIWSFVRAIKKNSISPLLFSGILFGVAALIRPIGLFLPPVMLIPLFFKKGKYFLRTSGYSFLFLLLFFITIGGWMVRNYQKGDAFVFSTTGGYNMLFYRGASVLALKEGKHLRNKQVINRLKTKAEKQYPPDAPEPVRSRVWWDMGTKLILHHPVSYLQVAAIGAGKLLLGPGKDSLARLVGETTSYETPLMIGLLTFESLFLALFYIALGAGFWFCIRSSSYDYLVLGGTIVLYFLFMSAGPEAYSRFRVPIVPFLSIFAGRGLEPLINSVMQTDSERDDQSVNPGDSSENQHR